MDFKQKFLPTVNEKLVEEQAIPTKTTKRTTRAAGLVLLAVAYFGVYPVLFTNGSALHNQTHGKNAAAASLWFNGDDGVSGYLSGFVASKFSLDPAFILDPTISSTLLSVLSSKNTSASSEPSLSSSSWPSFPRPHHRWMSPKAAENLFLTVPSEESCIAASRKYTNQEHRAGSGNDHLSALLLKEEWETAFGLPRTGPTENVFDAGSEGSQSMVRSASGIRVWVDKYFPVMNAPVSAFVGIMESKTSQTALWTAKLREDVLPSDPFSELRDEVPVFHGLSTPGNVTSEIVFAGYCRKADFEKLEEKGVEVEGKITLCKYGGVFRGLKVKASEEAGAVGCIIYSDPKDDGEITEANGYLPYPDGPARNPSSVQRGSVQYLSSYPGDPTTPFAPAYENATRLPGGNVPGIPSLPMSYADASHLLSLISGHGLPASDLGDDWEGSLNVSYYTGPSKGVVKLVNEVQTRVMPIWNTMAVIPGYIEDEVVAIGNHRDAWVLGASDPSSGTAVTHEIYEGLGKLLKSGWKPLRTIMIMSVDAEEYGLIGSTEWVEDFADWVREHVVSYLNLDSTGAGTQFHAAASPSLAFLLKSTSQEIPLPTDVTRSVWEYQETVSQLVETHWAEKSLVEKEFLAEEFATGTGIPSLGSGSDFTPFLQFNGIPSSDGPGFSPGPSDPVYHYHSIYDNEYWMEKYGDPGFFRHVACARILGLVLLRMADTLVLPLNITQYSLELSDYSAGVASAYAKSGLKEELSLSTLNEAILDLQVAAIKLDEEKESVLAELAKLTADSAAAASQAHAGCHGKKMRKLKNAMRKVLGFKAKKAHRYHELHHEDSDGETHELHHHVYAQHKAHHHGRPHGQSLEPKPTFWPHLPDPNKIAKIKELLAKIKIINKKLSTYEAGFISEGGLKGREWYRHLGVAPGRWLGYGTTTFPSITEAITLDKNITEANMEALRVEKLIKLMALKLAA